MMLSADSTTPELRVCTLDNAWIVLSRKGDLKGHNP